jgi:prevent-host-death family protein
MATKISATEAVRRFSELLNAVKYKHNSFTILRGGKPAASIIPVESFPGSKSLKDLAGIIKKLPHLNDDNELFARDISDIVHAQPIMPEQPVWE